MKNEKGKINNFQDYCRLIGLGKYIGELCSVVDEEFERSLNVISNKDALKLYLYDVPKLGPNGSCSITLEKEDNPYSLLKTFGIDTSNLSIHTHTKLLRRLKNIIDQLLKKVPADWIGIYKKITKKSGEEVLVKLSYIGQFSRAEFPLTEEFAKGSNNSTVGLSKKAKLVQSVSNYEGPYYKCDGRVVSEYCCPVLDEVGELVGIMDVESFEKDFFTTEYIGIITKVCFDLGRRQEFKNFPK